MIPTSDQQPAAGQQTTSPIAGSRIRAAHRNAEPLAQRRCAPVHRAHELNGTIELPASANTVNFMALTGNASDALTIKRGSYCQVW